MPPFRFNSAVCLKPRTLLTVVLGTNSKGRTYAANAARHGTAIASNESEVLIEPASFMIEHEGSGRRQVLSSPHRAGYSQTSVLRQKELHGYVCLTVLLCRLPWLMHEPAVNERKNSTTWFITHATHRVQLHYSQYAYASSGSSS